jgi:saccharopine dehydrogenase (NAD+, L-lysine-forming)
MAFLWLRDETKPHERRTCLLPEHAKTLVNTGHSIKVESSKLRIIPDHEYEKVGCEIAASGSWIHAEQKYYILGLKELPSNTFPLHHKHIYYAHCYKGQREAQQILSRFKRGGGTLLDMEYLIGENGKPLTVAPAGYLSGYVGAAMGIQLYVQKKLQQPLLLSAPYFIDKKQLLSHTVKLLTKVKKPPSALVIGCKGSSGRGAAELLKELNISPTLWGREETGSPTTLSKLNQFEIVLNCIYSNQAGIPFLTKKDLYREKKLSILVDVTCDMGGISHRFPFYQDTTTFSDPCLKAGPEESPVHVVGIDHLTNWLPLEASHTVAEPLFPLLKDLLGTDEEKLPAPWQATKNKFSEHINDL